MANEYSFSLDSALANSNDAKKAALQAVAQGGKAGLEAYQSAQKDLATQRSSALDAAMQRSSDTGGGTNTSQDILTGVFDRNAQSLGNLSAASQDRFAQMGASNDSYFSKLNSTLPLLANQNREKAMTQENQIKAVLAEAQAKAEAAAAAKQADREFQLLRDSERERASDERQSRSLSVQEARAAAKEKKAAEPTLDELLGSVAKQQMAAKQTIKDHPATGVYSNEYMKLANSGTAPGLADLASQLGQALGISPVKLGGLYAPGKQASITSSLTKMNPQQVNGVTKALASKYATKGVTESVVNTIMKDKDFKKAVDLLVNADPATTRQQWDRWISENFAKKPRTAAILRGEYLSRFPNEPKPESE